MAAPDTPLRVGIIVVFTVVEAAALAVWLGLVRGEPTVSATVAIGLGALAVGLFVEHVLTDVAVNGLDLDLPVGPVVVFTVSETVLWGLWLVIAETLGGAVGFGAALAFLAVLLIPQHTIEDNVLRARPLLSDLVNLRTAGFSVIEATGATAWLTLVFRPDLLGGVGGGVAVAVVGLGILTVALFVEHVLGVRFSSR